MRKLFYISAIFLALTISCSKKEVSNSKKGYQSDLPNFSNVEMDKVFRPQDSFLNNESAIKQQIQNYYQQVWDRGNLSGGILVAKGDKILFEDYRGFGREGEQMPIKANTALHVASVSKPVTAMAVMKLIDADKLRLDDNLTTIFKDFPYPNVTVKDLLTQRSGLPKYEYFISTIDKNAPELAKDFITNEDVLNMLIKYKPALARETNTGFMYCNTNYALLALIVEKYTKKSFPEAMAEMVFRPLGMKDTFIFQRKDIHTAAQSFYNSNKLYPLDRLDLIYGDKNLYTTPRDLYQFSKALFSKDFLKPELAQMIFQPYSNEKPGINNYGIGFRMKIFDNGEKLTYHNGWWHGTNSVFGHLLKSKVTIIAIGNKYSQRVYSALALSGLFENFPYEQEKLYKILKPQGDTVNSNYEE